MSCADVAGSVRSAFKTPRSAAVLRRQSNDDKDLSTFDTWAIYPFPFLFSRMGRSARLDGACPAYPRQVGARLMSRREAGQVWPKDRG